MPSTASPLSICNQALSWLGANLITSFEDGTTEANLCKANYDQLRDTVLESYWWSFSTTRVRLGSAAPETNPDASPYGDTNRYKVPQDCLRIWTVGQYKDLREGDNLTWTLEAGYVVCPVHPVWAKYTFRLEDTTQMSPAFVQALAARISMDLCLPITESNRKLEAMQTLYGVKLDEAKTTDGTQGTNERIRSTWMRNSRARTSNSVG